MKYYLSLGCVFKNEAMNLYEFLEHHLYHGVEHFYLINDFSDDDYLEILTPYIEKNIVTLFHNDFVSNEVGRQKIIYNKYFKQILNETFWLGVLDLDEFLYNPKGEIDIKNVIKKYEDYTLLNVDCILFGSNKHIFQPFSIVSGFDKCFNLTQEMLDNGGVFSCKSIMKSSEIIDFDVHYSHLQNHKPIAMGYLNGTNELYINHYQIQSKEFWRDVKLRRGDADNYSKREMDTFYWLDKIGNELLNTTLKNQNHEVIQKVIKYKLEKIKDNKFTFIFDDNFPRNFLKTILEKFYDNEQIKSFLIIDNSLEENELDFDKDKIKDKIKDKVIFIKNKSEISDYINTKYTFFPTSEKTTMSTI